MLRFIHPRRKQNSLESIEAVFKDGDTEGSWTPPPPTDTPSEQLHTEQLPLKETQTG